MKQIFTTALVLSGVIAYAQPSGSCTAGTTKLGTDGKLYGCVATSWKKLTEDVVSNASIGAAQGITQNLNGVVQAREQDNSVSQLNNIGFTPISVSDAPSHVVGKIFYSSANKHFYQGVSGGLWHQIDNEIFTPSPKCLERIKDKNYGDGDHNFIYCAVQGPNGKKWLNLNLGAEYARESSEHFNPEAVPTGYNDWKAFGSLFQDGRKADGHELVTYYHPTLKTDYTADITERPTDDYWYVNRKYPTTTTLQDILNSNHSYVVEEDWAKDRSSMLNMWDGQMLNNPCPNGYRIINFQDIKSILVDDTVVIKDPNQGYTTASIISHKNYPNLVLMTAPTVSNNVVDNPKIRDNGRRFQLTQASGFDHSNGSGTSSLWSLVSYPEFLLMDNIMMGYGSYTYNKVAEPSGWEFDTDKEYSLEKTTYLVFDRGKWYVTTDGTSFDGDYIVRFSDMYMSMAIRCVEK